MKSKSNLQVFPYRIVIAYYIIISAILRITLWAAYGVPAKIPWVNLPKIFLIGAAQDILALLFVLLPLSFTLLLPEKTIYSRKSRVMLSLLSFVFIFATLFLLPAEFLFFDEFSSRFNLVAVDYFAYPTEVFGNIWESYPIPLLISLILALTFLIWRLLWPKFTAFFENPRNYKNRFSIYISHLALVVLFIAFGSFTYLPAHSNRVQTQISQNGLLTFTEALFTNHLEFDQYYAQLDPDRAHRLMRSILKEKGGEFVSDRPENITRRFPKKENGLGKLNVVIIGEESLGAQYIGALGDTRGLTPNFDRLSQEGILFENAFATGTRTVRGLEAISMSFPPIPSESTVKRPGNENMANLGSVLNSWGYTSSFLYGGFGMFDNMNYFFGNNGFNLSDRLDVKKVTFSNIWGICDEDLFSHATDYFDDLSDKKQPFFSIIMTTSNHKPFTFRKGVPGVPESGGGRDAGVKYADFALGKFFEEAKTKNWYKNTIFVVVGDHDSRVYGRAYIPVERFRVALMILAPGHLKAQRVPNIISQIDLIPTIMGLLGLAYEGPFYGRDMLAPNAPLSQPVMINHNHDVGLYENGILAVTSLNKVQKTFHYTNDGKTIEIENDNKMQDELTAYLQTAYHLFQNKNFKLFNN